jgi:hypothetical protein
LASFVWIGASMTFRRAQDAWLWPGLGILFFAPLLNYVVMIGLALAPSRARAPTRPRTDPGRLRSLVGLLFAVSFPLAMMVLSVHGLERYGFGIFVGTPFALGVWVGYVFNVTRERTVGQTTLSCAALLLAVALALLLLSFEGMACIVMATPIIVPLAWLGAMLGRGLARMGTGAATASTFLLLPLGLLAVDERPVAAPLRAMVTSVEIDAPPDECLVLTAARPAAQPSPHSRGCPFNAVDRQPVVAQHAVWLGSPDRQRAPAFDAGCHPWADERAPAATARRCRCLAGDPAHGVARPRQFGMARTRRVPPVAAGDRAQSHP